MPTKKWVIYFIVSFTATIIAGFFIWSSFVDFSGNPSKPDPLTASLSGPSLTQDNLPESDEIVSEIFDLETAPVEPQKTPAPLILTEEEKQNLFDDIQEKLDVISSQVADLQQQQTDFQEQSGNTERQNQSDSLDLICAVETSLSFQCLVLKAQHENQENNEQPAQNSSIVETTSVSAADDGGGGGIAIVTYPKILISEVEISPIEQRFIELYNPNEQEVSLYEWYLQRKDSNDTAWNSLISRNRFESKTIPSHGYFLISRELSGPGGYPDITVSFALSDSNSLALKNPNGEISDKLGWSNALDFELMAAVSPSNGQSIGRKVLPDGSEEETDNNLNDFELQTPTPKSQNITYIAPLEPPPPPPPADTSPPEVNFSLDDIQTSLDFTINFTITDPIVENVSSSGAASYIFRWQVDGGEWQEDAPVLVDGNPIFVDFAQSFVGEDGKTYNFQVKATDAAGNESGWLPEPPSQTKIELPVIPPVAENMLTNEFFNEGWEGTSSAGNPIEWIWGKRGGIAVEDLQLVTGMQSFYHEPYSDPHYLKQLGKELEAGKTYYVRVWVKGTGKIKAGVEVAEDIIREPNFYDSLVDAGWTMIDYSYTVAAGEEASNGGVTLKLTRYDSTDERLVIGAVWLSTAEPPDGWPL